MYDEHGNTSPFSVSCFYLILLLPLTYYYWPREEKGASFDCVRSSSNKSSLSAKVKYRKVRQCHCEGCVRKADAKRKRELSESSWVIVK